MVKVEHFDVSGWKAAIRGMRNPKNSWDLSDSFENENGEYILGPNDMKLATTLMGAGSEHAKFARMVHVSFDVTGPMFWWAEFDTYKIATTRDSCSKMHKIHVKPFELDDFSHEGCDEVQVAKDAMNTVVQACEELRQKFNETQERKYWRALIELLPESYNMKATWDGSLETVLSINKQRDHHKLKEEWEPLRNAFAENIPNFNELYAAYCKRGRRDG